MIATAPAAAKTFEPTRKDDPPPGNCEPNNCSLREAFKASNDRPGRDTIVLGKGRYELEVANSNGDFNKGSLDLIDGLKLRGRGAGKTTIDANDLDQVITNWKNSAVDAFSIRGMTLTGGDASVGAQNHGGAILVGAPDKLELASVALIGNSAPSGGGGLFSSSPEATIVNSTIAGNDAPTGGGIHVTSGTLGLQRTSITGNEATFGGGIESTAPELTVTKSTISGNTASEGGGLDLRPADALPISEIRSSTISGNTATNKAGGILADGNPAGGPDPPEEPELHVTNSTIADNKADNDGGGVMGDNAATLDIENASIGFNRANNDNVGTAVGGGVFQHGNANFSVDDSVLASNSTGQGGSDDDCSAAQVFSGAGNVINSTPGCITSFTTPFNKYSATLIASGLADNGGPTETMAIPPSSGAVGFANACPKRDQRGKLRPADCDSGAYENNPKR